MGLFSKGNKTVAKAAVGLATAATTSLGGNYAKHYVQSKSVQSHRANNPVSRVVRTPSAHVRKK